MSVDILGRDYADADEPLRGARHAIACATFSAEVWRRTGVGWWRASALLLAKLAGDWTVAADYARDWPDGSSPRETLEPIDDQRWAILRELDPERYGSEP